MNMTKLMVIKRLLRLCLLEYTHQSSNCRAIIIELLLLINQVVALPQGNFSLQVNLLHSVKTR